MPLPQHPWSRIRFTLIVLFLTALYPISSFCQGHVYLVLGSDTSIWDGLSTSQYHCHYDGSLYSDPSQNASKVMNASFRYPLRDSEGVPLKLTWWMHSGNVFRFADNCDVPLANTIALHLMKKYHGKAVTQLGDELTLHYHTWDWTDENGDGRYYWNQALSFQQCWEDFDVTLCQYLLEEQVFPVSFRSGWHYMDNLWQNRLDELLPFSLHNDYPAVRNDVEEPTDNIYDWSMASAEFVPFHPAPDNYQLPGTCKGWNVRSIYMKSMGQTLMDKTFQKAAAGVDQVVCLWSHLPEADFPEQIQRVHDLAIAAAQKHPAVKFHYMTAIEAMQAWLKTGDHQAPVLQMDEITRAGQPVYVIHSSEPIFQKQPFVALKDIYDHYQILPCTQVGDLTWEAMAPLSAERIVKAGVMVTDTVGNQSMRFISYLPEDIFLDNRSSGYLELTRQFSTIAAYGWGIDARAAALAPGDSAAIRIPIPVTEARKYHLYFQLAPVAAPLDSFTVVMAQNNQIQWRKHLAGSVPAKTWHYIDSEQLDPAASPMIYLIGKNLASSSRDFSPDGIKVTARIADRQLAINPQVLQWHEISLYDTVTTNLTLSNRGEQALTIQQLQIPAAVTADNASMPLVIAPFAERQIQLSFYTEQPLSLTDTLHILSDDPIQPHMKIVLNLNAQNYFTTVDNEDSGKYLESGPWQTSVAQALGPTSRFVYLAGNPGAYAQFTTTLQIGGRYEISDLVPTTVNASNRALYIVLVQGDPIDSVYVDQNAGSGSWRRIGLYDLPRGIPVQLRIVNVAGYTQGAVLRADGIRFTLLQETSVAKQKNSAPQDFRLWPCYPNPFNSSTHLRYNLTRAGTARFDIYDINGRWVANLLDEVQASGLHTITWNGKNQDGLDAASGVYIAVLHAQNQVQSQRIVLIR